MNNWLFITSSYKMSKITGNIGAVRINSKILYEISVPSAVRWIYSFKSAIYWKKKDKVGK